MLRELTNEIGRFVAASELNNLPDGSGPYFDPPLVGIAALGDLLFAAYKQTIGPFHLTPAEVFAASFDDPPAVGSVICWILPLTAAVRTSNRPQRELPSRQWSLARNFGEGVNAALRRHLVVWLAERGARAVAPQLSPAWRELPETPTGRASTWSERHAAYAAGLGTFSLNDGLITAKGIAHRCGSVVTELVLPPTPRPAKGYADNCLYYREGSCGACIGRCPVGAISFAGHDKERCGTYVYGTVPAAVAADYGVSATGCGLCQTRVPCEACIPRGRTAG